MLFGACREPGAACNALFLPAQLNALGLHWHQPFSTRATPPRLERQRKGKRDHLETSSEDNPWPREPVLPSCSHSSCCHSHRYSKTSLHLLLPLYNGKKVHCHDRCRASEPLLVPSGSLSAQDCLNLVIIQISYDGEIRKHKNPHFPSGVEPFAPG